MLLEMNGLWTVDSKQQNLSCVIKTDHESTLKTLLQKMKIVTLSMQKFAQDIKEYGKIKITLEYEGDFFVFIFSQGDISSLTLHFLQLGGKVKTVNTIEDELSDNDITKILNEAQKTIEEQKQREIEQKMAEQKKLKKDFGSQSRSKVAKTIENTLDNIEDIKKRASEVITGEEVKKLKELGDELKKLKRSSNKDKMTHVLEDVFLLMDSVQKKYFLHAKNHEKKVLPGSSVSDIDIQRQYQLREKSQQVKQAGTSKSGADGYYQMFGKFGMFVNFLKQDFSSRTQKLHLIIYYMSDMIEYVMLFLAINLGALFVLNKFRGMGNSEDIFSYLVYVGIVGFSLTCTKFIKKKSVVMVTLRLISSLAVFFVLQAFLLKRYVL